MMHLRNLLVVDLLPFRRPPSLVAIRRFFAPAANVLNLGPCLHLVRVKVMLEVFRQFSLLVRGM